MRPGDTSEDAEPRYDLGDRQPGGYYSLRGHPDLLVRITRDKLHELKESMELSREVPDEVRYVRPRKVGVYRGPEFQGERRAMLLKRPLGHVIHEESDPHRQRWQRMNQLLAEAPQEHYDKLVDDAEILEEIGLRIDPARANNFFYHPENGFTIAPASHGNDLSPEFLAISLAATYLVDKFDTQGLSQRDVENIREIHDKLRTAGVPRNDQFESGLVNLESQLL
ncbi:MAG: hypothetical protein ABEI58_00045 [Candidatus Nanohaloarchaea archaeon]